MKIAVNQFIRGHFGAATLLLYGLLMILAGCSTSGPREIRTPVAIPCVDHSDVPVPVPPAGPLPEDARQAADLLGAVVLQLRANERILRALISSCTR